VVDLPHEREQISEVHSAPLGLDKRPAVPNVGDITRDSLRSPLASNPLIEQVDHVGDRRVSGLAPASQ
jgi:hypothetical protein